MWSWKLSNTVINMTIKPASNITKRAFLSSSSSTRVLDRKRDSTVDQADVKVFTNLMKDWWDDTGPMNLLHKFNTVRVPFIRDGLVQCSTAERAPLPLKGKTILDVGCGGGILSEALARLGAVVTGLDASKGLIDIAEEHKYVDPKIADNRPTYVNSTIEDHVKTFPCHYDAVVASEVIEHVNNKELFLKSCVGTVKPGGRIFFTTPSKTRWAQFGVIFVAEQILGAIPRGAHQYEKFISSNELSFMLERNNCHVELCYGIIFNPITQKWDFSKYTQFMYAIQALKLS